MEGGSEREAERQQSKWEGNVEVEVAAPLERVWAIASDFYGLQRWYPGLEACERVEGVEGCVRYCAVASSWVKEKLLSLDSTLHTYTYVVVEANMEALLGYQATFTAEPGQEGEDTCVVKWVFHLEPVAGQAEEEFVGYLKSVLTGMSRALEQCLLPPPDFTVF